MRWVADDYLLSIVLTFNISTESVRPRSNSIQSTPQNKIGLSPVSNYLNISTMSRAPKR